MAAKKLPGFFLILLFSFLTQGNAIRSPRMQNDTSQIAVQTEDPISVQSVNCPVWGYCDEAPKLLFQLQEKAEKKDSYEIHVVIGDTEEICKEDFCLLEMPVTDEDGLRVEYYARTSMWNETLHQEFAMRNMITDDVPGQYLFELLGHAW